MLPTSFIKFLLVGVANTAIGLSIIFAAKAFAGAGDVAANVAGYAVGLAVSFLLNKRWTFKYHGKRFSSLLRFLAVFAVSYVTNLVTVLSLIGVFGLNSFWSQALGMIPYSALFYIGSRRFAFPEMAANTQDVQLEEAKRRSGTEKSLF
jgi:putative flippase GtrA